MSNSITDNDKEILSYLLIAVCILSILCWLSNKTEGFSKGLRFKNKEGYTGSMYPSKTFGYSYTHRAGFEDEPVNSMNGLETTMTPQQVLPKKLLNNTVALRLPDSSIQIDNWNLTDDDVYNGNDQFGYEIVDPALRREKQNNKARESLSIDILGLTDLSDRNQLYGPRSVEYITTG